MKDFLNKITKSLKEEPDPAFARRAKIIFENLSLLGKENVLEIGCGRGFYLKTLVDNFTNLKITGIDLNERYLLAAKKFINNSRVKLLRADAIKLPFKNNTFDRIIASEILEHIPDDQKAIEEMFRVLVPGGIILITVPHKNYPFFWDPLNWVLEKLFKKHVASTIWWLAGIWADHVRLYEEKELTQKLENQKFKIEKVYKTTHFCFPFAHLLLYGIGKNLVEKNWFKAFNRFNQKASKNFLNQFLLLPLRLVDLLNKKDNYRTSVNLIFKVKK